jgi:hypothetical protein
MGVYDAKFSSNVAHMECSARSIVGEGSRIGLFRCDAGARFKRVNVTPNDREDFHEKDTLHIPFERRPGNASSSIGAADDDYGDHSRDLGDDDNDDRSDDDEGSDEGAEEATEGTGESRQGEREGSEGASQGGEAPG